VRSGGDLGDDSAALVRRQEAGDRVRQLRCRGRACVAHRLGAYPRFAARWCGRAHERPPTMRVYEAQAGAGGRRSLQAKEQRRDVCRRHCTEMFGGEEDPLQELRELIAAVIKVDMSGSFGR
jgi:hypothetical protein